MIPPDARHIYHPSDESEIISLIGYAIQEHLQVRVVGASQSVLQAIYADGYGALEVNTLPNLNLMLDRMKAVRIDQELKQVTVQAGCNLGFDPYDPSQASSVANSLCAVLSASNLALPGLPDAMHQTISGFMSTGSGIGSVAQSLLEALVSVRLIDGRGQVHILHKPPAPQPDDLFYAAGVSMGLLGIITEVSLQVIPSYHITGQQLITSDSAASLDFFGPGGPDLPSLEAFISRTEYSRLLWWPYPSLRRLVVWQARKMQPGDYNGNTGSPDDFHPKPYENMFPKVLGTQIPGQIAANILFQLIGNFPQNLIDLLGNRLGSTGNGISTSFLGDLLDISWPVILPKLMNLVIPVEGPKAKQLFWDTWSDGLPMDQQQYSNNLFQARRCELWFPLSESLKAIGVLKNYYETAYFKNANPQNNNYANSCYTMEIMGGKSSSFWLSPSYGRDCLRINFFSFQGTSEKVIDYYQQFWKLFRNAGIPYRLHWGYFLPPDAEGVNYNIRQYPLWDEFVKLRAQMDPGNLFLTTYWKNQLNLPG